jgi:hypothetical protein
MILRGFSLLRKPDMDLIIDLAVADFFFCPVVFLFFGDFAFFVIQHLQFAAKLINSGYGPPLKKSPLSRGFSTFLRAIPPATGPGA